MPSARIFLAPGSYTGVGIVGGTVPTLSAGTLSTAGPINVGQSVTYTPSHSVTAGQSFQWRRDGVNISGATSATYTAVSADAGTTLTCRETLGDKQTPVVSSGCSVTASTISATNIYRGSIGSGIASTVRTTTIDLSAYGAGDKVICYTNGDTTTPLTDHTLDGVSAIERLFSNGGLSGKRCTALVFELTGPGSASASLVTTLLAAGTPVGTIYVVENGAVSHSVGGDYADANWPFNAGQTPANADNIVLGVIIGRTLSDTQSATWTNMTELFDGYILNSIGQTSWVSEGIATDLPTTPFTPTGSVAVSERKSAILTVVTPL